MNISNSSMPEAVRNTLSPRDWATRIQINGVLSKKPLGHQSSRWTKRFFLVKDGFLMYYDVNEKKDYERRDYFNIHPKGVVPLGECHFKPCREPQQPFCILLESPEIDGKLVLAAESEFERDRWLETLEQSRRVTWKNTQLGDEMIRRLQNEGLEAAIEKQSYIDRLQLEVLALSEEKIKSEELERLNQELEEEKQKLASFTKEIQEEYDRIKEELNETVNLVKQVEEDRIVLSQSLQQQRQHLENLNKDKQRILEELQQSMQEQTCLSQEKKSLSQRTEELQLQLQDIESQTSSIERTRISAERRLRDNEERLEQLEAEKTAITNHAHELEFTIHDLVSQKEMTEKELKEEIRARISAEERLKEAERSLRCIDKAVNSQSHRIESEAKEEMTVNVKKLKDFFEDLAEEARITSDKPLIIRNGIMARKTIARRAQTLRYENRKRSTRVQSCDVTSLRPKTTTRRVATSVNHGTSEDMSAVFEENF
ncbi:unnamed protein product [Candidula unifasciata]|uniref:PH domain-containing protein n=1 Tax=Candidula unifasciata TaxID=100452 RepID=A0A8S3Z3V1_9EUPU|nr:unnamed protein product [Candidula unifasciata]